MSESNTNATHAASSSSSPSLSRLSFISTLTMLSPMLGHYLHEYDLYSLCSICCSMPQLIEFEVEKMHQRRRIKDEAEREEILRQLSAIEAIRVANGPEIQAIHDAALQLLHRSDPSVDLHSDSESITGELLTHTSALVYEKGACLRFSDNETSVRGGNLCDRLRTLSEKTVISDEERMIPDVVAKHVADVQLGFTYLRCCLLSNPLLFRNRTYIGNGGWHMLNECLETTMKGRDHWRMHDPAYKVHGEVHVEFEKFTVWLIHLLEVMHVRNGMKTIQQIIPEGHDINNIFYPARHIQLHSLSYLIFSDLEHLVPDQYSSFVKGSEDARRWYQIQWNLFRRGDESCINPPLSYLTTNNNNSKHPDYLLLNKHTLTSYDSETHFYLSKTLPSSRLDLTVILCGLPQYQARMRMALKYAWKHRQRRDTYVNPEEIRRKWMNSFLGDKEKKKKMSVMIQRFHMAVRSGYVETVRGKLDVWIGKEEEKAKQEVKEVESKSSSQSTAAFSSTAATVAASSSASSSSSTSSQYYSLLFDPTRDSILRRCLISIYFDLIKGKAYKLIRQIHACLHPLFTTELRDPKTGLSPLHYYLELKAMSAYRLFDELANEAVRYHEGFVTDVLDECSTSGVSIRELLVKPKHVELQARFFDAHPEIKPR